MPWVDLAWKSGAGSLIRGIRATGTVEVSVFMNVLLWLVLTFPLSGMRTHRSLHSGGNFNIARGSKGFHPTRRRITKRQENAALACRISLGVSRSQTAIG